MQRSHHSPLNSGVTDLSHSNSDQMLSAPTFERFPMQTMLTLSSVCSSRQGSLTVSLAHSRRRHDTPALAPTVLSRSTSYRALLLQRALAHGCLVVVVVVVAGACHLVSVCLTCLSSGSLFPAAVVDVRRRQACVRMQQRRPCRRSIAFCGIGQRSEQRLSLHAITNLQPLPQPPPSTTRSRPRHPLPSILLPEVSLRVSGLVLACSRSLAAEQPVISGCTSQRKLKLIPSGVFVTRFCCLVSLVCLLLRLLLLLLQMTQCPLHRPTINCTQHGLLRQLPLSRVSTRPSTRLPSGHRCRPPPQPLRDCCPWTPPRSRAAEQVSLPCSPPLT